MDAGKVDFLVACGVDRQLAVQALRHYDGDAQTALNKCIDGAFTPGMSSSTASGATQATAGAGGSTSQALVPVASSSGAAASSAAASSASASGTGSDMDKAIAASLALKQVKEKNPLELQRTDASLPLGLRNLGNTCFVNCLLQVYFHIKEFRDAVLGLSLPDTIIPSAIMSAASDGPGGRIAAEETEGEGEAEKPQAAAKNSSGDDSVESRKSRLLALKEMQKVFAYLALSDKKYIDPTELLLCFKATGVVQEIGIQEDITEVSTRFLTLMENSKQLTAIVRSMFYGKSVTEFRFPENESDSEKHGLVKREDTFSHMPAVVSDDLTEFYDSLDRETSSELVSYTSGDFKTQADKLTLIEEFPTVFTLLLRRIRFDADSQTVQKINTPFHFDREVDFDRYLFARKEEILRRRAVVRGYRDHIAELNTRLDQLQADGRDGNLLVADTIALLARLKKEAAVVAMLEGVHADLTQRIGALRAEVVQFRERIRMAFDDMSSHGTRQHYYLHAVVVHEGRTVDMGHYSCYVRVDGEKWYKFNDTLVDAVEDDNFEEQVWSHNDKSVYLLLYISEATLQKQRLRATGAVPLPLVSMVEADNAAFIVEVEEFIIAEKKAVEEERTTFTRRFQEQWAALPQKDKPAPTPQQTCLAAMRTASWKPTVDERIASLPFFCWLVGEEAVARYELACAVYLEVVHHRNENPLEAMLLLVDVSKPPEDKAALVKGLRERFVTVTRYFAKGIKFMTYVNFNLASPTEAFRFALAHDDLIPEAYPKIKRRREITKYFAMVLNVHLTKGTSDMRVDRFSCVDHWRAILDNAKLLLPDEEFRNYVRFHTCEYFFRAVMGIRGFFHRFNAAQCATLNDIITEFQQLNELDPIPHVFENLAEIPSTFGLAEFHSYADQGLAEFIQKTQQRLETVFYTRLKSYRTEAFDHSGSPKRKSTYNKWTAFFQPGN